MPKLKKTENEVKDERFRILIRQKMIGTRFNTNDKLAKAIGIQPGSLYNKLSGRTEWSRRELRMIFGVLNFEPEEILMVM